MSPYSVSRWKKLCGQAPQTTASASGANVQELARRLKVLERENADLGEQRAILKKAVAIVLELPRAGMA